MDYISIEPSQFSDKQLDHEISIRLNSPRLREACRRQGINVKHLTRKSLQEIRQMHSHDNLSRANIIMIAQHYEERRQAKLGLVMKERNKMIEDEIAELDNKPEYAKRGLTSSVKRASASTIDESPKLRLEMGEMLLRQQEEINELEEHEIEDGDAYGGEIDDYQRKGRTELVKQSAMRTHLSNKAQRGTIKLIDKEYFDHDYNHHAERMKVKAQNKQQKDRLGAMRKKNLNVYKREVEAFMTYELQNRKREHLRDLVTGTKRYQRKLMENRMTAREKRHLMNPQQKAMKGYFEEQLKMQEEADMQMRKERSVISRARQQSKAWVDKETPRMMRSAGFEEYRQSMRRPPRSEYRMKTRNQSRSYENLGQDPQYNDDQYEDDEQVDFRDLSLDDIKPNPNAQLRLMTPKDVARRRLLLGYHHDPYRMSHGDLGTAYMYYPEVFSNTHRSPRQTVEVVRQSSVRASPAKGNSIRRECSKTSCNSKTPLRMSSRNVSEAQSPSQAFAQSASNFAKKVSSGKTSLFSSPDNKFRRTQDTDMFHEV